MGKCLSILIIISLLLVSCSTQTTPTCPKSDCPLIDCNSCPVKTETKIETKTTTNTIYVCSDLREVKNKEDCLKADSEGWYEIKNFSGSSSKTTEPFTINSKRWRYTVSCISQYGDYNYNILINKLVDDQPSGVNAKVMAKCELNSEPDYVYDGGGEFFFVLTTANVKSWSIKVEALK